MFKIKWGGDSENSLCLSEGGRNALRRVSDDV